MESYDVKRVAVIGAGLSGICTLRRLSEEKIFQLTCFEKNFKIGGTWIYTDQTSENGCEPPVTTGMYANLRTNIPKQLMEIDGFPLPDDIPSFPGQPEMLQYLNRFADYFNIRKYIKFNTKVEKIKPVNPGKRDTKWSVTHGDVRKKNDAYTDEFDAVIVCSGNCTRPRIPDIPGEKDFEGIVMHSMRYRHPELFAGQTVALLGAHFSGMDIALHLSNYAKKIYLCHGKPVMDTLLPRNIIEKASTFNRIKQSSVILENGEELEVDAIIYCTGYQYYFPFLPDGIIQTTDDNKMVTSLYKEIVPVDYNSLMFMAVPRLIAFFRHCDHQALFIRAILDGSVKLPDKEEMQRVIDDDVQYRPVGADTQWAWNDELSYIAGNFDPNPPVLKKIWDHHFAVWAKDIVKCRKLAYKTTGPDSFILV